MTDLNIENINKGTIINCEIINPYSVRRIFIQGLVKKAEHLADFSDIYLQDVSENIVIQYAQHLWILLDKINCQYFELNYLDKINFPNHIPELGKNMMFEILSAKTQTEVVAGREFKVCLRYVCYEGKKIVQAGLSLPAFEPDLVFWEPKFLSKKGQWKYMNKQGLIQKINLKEKKEQENVS